MSVALNPHGTIMLIVLTAMLANPGTSCGGRAYGPRGTWPINCPIGQLWDCQRNRYETTLDHAKFVTAAIAGS